MSGGWVALGELVGMLAGLAALWYCLGRKERAGPVEPSDDARDGGGEGGG